MRAKWLSVVKARILIIHMSVASKLNNHVDCKSMLANIIMTDIINPLHVQCHVTYLNMLLNLENVDLIKKDAY